MEKREERDYGHYSFAKRDFFGNLRSGLLGKQDGKRQLTRHPVSGKKGKPTTGGGMRGAWGESCYGLKGILLNKKLVRGFGK